MEDLDAQMNSFLCRQHERAVEQLKKEAKVSDAVYRIICPFCEEDTDVRVTVYSAEPAIGYRGGAEVEFLNPVCCGEIESLDEEEILEELVGDLRPQRYVHG